jgi:DNA (cytosine-5)-methyltransferase 1
MQTKISLKSSRGNKDKKPKISHNKKLTVVDMFCGCGGLSQGFKDAGFEVLFGIDNDAPSLTTYEHNFGNGRGARIDLSSKNFLRDFEKELAKYKKDLDMVIAGPPCQGFSLTGPRNFDDPRNQLYLSVFAVVKKFKPKAFLIENVKGMKAMYGGEILGEVVKRFVALGYKVTPPKILSSADYGVPQIRERLFIVGFRNDIGAFEFPKPSHTEDTYVSCEEAISDLQSREKEFGIEIDDYEKNPKSSYQEYMRKGSKKLFNHVATKHTELVKSVIRLVPEGKNHKSLPPGVGETRKFNEAWTRYHRKKPSRTIDTGHRNHFHYKWDRVPTVRENARLQSFKDSFQFMGTRTQQNKQVGNAVPPLLAFSLAKKILKSIK